VTGLVSYGVLFVAGAFGLSWAFLSGFYSEFGLTLAEVGVGYEDAVSTLAVFGSMLGLVVVGVAVCLTAASAVNGDSPLSRVASILLLTVPGAGIVIALNFGAGPSTRWAQLSPVIAVLAPIAAATWGRGRPRYLVLICLSAYLLFLPYVRELGVSLSGGVPKELSDPWTGLVPRWPTVVCVMPNSEQISLPVGPDWSEPWLYFGNRDGTLVLARENVNAEEPRSVTVMRLPADSVYLASLDRANRTGNYYVMSCLQEGLDEWIEGF
jgi:hypothetical protein